MSDLTGAYVAGWNACLDAAKRKVIDGMFLTRFSKEQAEFNDDVQGIADSLEDLRIRIDEPDGEPA